MQCTHRIYHSNISLLYFTCNTFTFFQFSSPRLFWFFLCFFILYIYILWFNILLLLHCFGRAFQYKTVFSSRFFRLCDVETSFQCRPFLFQGLILYRYTAYYYHSKILRRLCVAISWFPYISCPASGCIGSLCARTSMFAYPKHQYVVFLTQFLKGGFYTGKNRVPHTPDAAPAVKGGFYTYGRGNFCFPLHPCIYTYYPNFNASVSPYRSKERFLHRKKRRFLSTPLSPTLYPLWVRGCTQCNKREVSTPEKISRSNLHLSLHGQALPLLQREISTLRNL